MKELTESNWFTCPGFLWQRELPKEYIKAEEVDKGDPELKRAQALAIKVKEDMFLSDRLERFSDWKRAVKAIAGQKRCARSVKALVERFNEATSL